MLGFQFYFTWLCSICCGLLQLRYNSHRACQRVFEKFRTFHKTGKPSCGEALDDCNEQTNAEFANIKKPTPKTIGEFSNNLNVYRENDWQLDVLMGQPKRANTKAMKMRESIDLLVNAFKRSFGTCEESLCTMRTVSTMADGYGGAQFNCDLAGSSRLFQGSGSTTESKKYVAEKLKRKDGLFDPTDGKKKVENADSESDAGSQGDSESDSDSSDDGIPLPQALKNKRTAWVSTNKPRKGETLDNYHKRIGTILQSGVKGNGSMLAVLNTKETYQLAAKEHDAATEATGAFVYKMNKILDQKLVGAETRYLVRYVKHRNQPAKQDEWLPEAQLREGRRMLEEYRKQLKIDKGEAYEVEYIYDKRIANGTVECHVKWKGYRKHKDDWEPAANLKGSEDAINEFNAKGASQQKSKKRKKNPSSDSE